MALLRTSVELDKELFEEAFRLLPEVDTKKGVIEFALRELVEKRKKKDIRELFGQVQLEDGYEITYKKMREDKIR